MSSHQSKTGFATTCVVAIAVSCTLPSTSAIAQDNSADLEEIVVSARKRDELLKDVPVSISVISGQDIAAAGIENQWDLFELTPGMTFDQVQDRQASRPSVRGVQSQAQNPVRQKISSFMDGAPVLGQTGSLQFIGVDQIAILRGPQSAAFGRSTFGGAINYVTKDPGENWEGNIQLMMTNLEREAVSFSASGPINDWLGVTVDANFDEFQGPDEWVSSDGFRLGGTSTDFYTGKLVIQPTDALNVELRYTHLETDDNPQIGYYIDQSALNACSNYTLENGQSYIQGEFNCALPGLAGGVPLNHAPEEDFPVGSPEYFLVQSFSVVDPRSFVERDRIQLNLDFELDNGSAIEVLASNSEDELRRWFDADGSDATATVANMMGMLSVTGVNSMANPNTIEEQYAEVRWVSPDDSKLRMVFGASWFDYEFLTNIYTQYAGVILGLEDEANNGNPFSPVNILSDFSTNTGVFANITYDINDDTTVSFEARYQNDEIVNVNNVSGLEFENTTDSFQPRVAVNHAINDDWSVYGQFAIGNNPAGVNIPFTLNNVPESLAAAQAAGFIQYDDQTFLNFDEEELTSFEVGVKGATADRKLQLTAALYVMEWDDMIQPFNFNWDGAWNDGSFDPNGTVFTMGETMARTFINSGKGDLAGLEIESTYRATDNLSIRGAFAFQKAEFDNFCDPLAVTNLFFTPTDTTASGAPFNCVDVSGNDIPGQPDFTAAVAATYTDELAGDWEWSGRLDYRYQSSEYINADAVNLAEISGFSLVNASVTFYDERWNIRLYGNNLTDEDTPQTIDYNTDNNIGGNTRNFFIRPRIPREYGIRIGLAFGQE
ncbi:MAG: TonB-dependent receptor [Woeseiaceae bacterium]